MALQIKVLWGAWHSWDLPLWDGSAYFQHGLSVMNSFRFPPLDWSPFFAAYYGIFHLLLGDTGPFTVYLAHRIVTILLVIALLNTLLRAVLPNALAWLLTAYVVLLPAGAGNQYVVHLFALIPLLAAYCAATSKSASSSGLTLMFLLLASLVRSEFAISFISALLVLALSDYLAKKGMGLPIRQWLRPFVPLIWACLFLSLVVIRAGPPHSSVNRSWGAFGQHYAWGYKERHPEWDSDHWLKWRDAVAESFGNVDSLPKAVLSNPSEVVDHLLWNLHLFPGEVADMLTPHNPVSLWVIVFCLGLTGACFPILTYWQGPRGRGSRPCLSTMGSRRRLWPILLCGSLPPLASALIIRPRAIYLLSLLPTALLVAGLGLEALCRRYPHAGAGKWLPLITFPVLVAVSGMPFRAPAPSPVRSVTSTLSEIVSDEPYGLLAESARAFCIYSMPGRCQPLEIYEVPFDTRPLERFLTERNVQVIVVNRRLANNLPPAGQAFVAELRSHPEQSGWRCSGGANGLDIYIRTKQ